VTLKSTWEMRRGEEKREISKLDQPIIVMENSETIDGSSNLHRQPDLLSCRFGCLSNSVPARGAQMTSKRRVF